MFSLGCLHSRISVQFVTNGLVSSSISSITADITGRIGEVESCTNTVQQMNSRFGLNIFLVFVNQCIRNQNLPLVQVFDTFENCLKSFDN